MTATRKLIGVTGQAGAGKDHLFYEYSTRFNQQAERFALADGVKADIKDTLSLDPYDHYTALDSKPYSPEVRALLQWWGTELRRNQDEDYWIDHLARRIDQRLPRVDVPVFVTDVRFVNEARWVRQQGGIVVKVEAGPLTRAARLGITPERLVVVSSHPSESHVHLIEPDLHINSESPDSLEPGLEVLHNMIEAR